MRYDVEVTLDAEIVSVFGPFPAGSYPNDTVFIELDNLPRNYEYFNADGTCPSSKRPFDPNLHHMATKHLGARNHHPKAETRSYSLMYLHE